MGVRGQTAMPPCPWWKEGSWEVSFLWVASETASWGRGAWVRGQVIEKGVTSAGDTRDEQLAVPEMGAGKGEDWAEDGVRRDHTSCRLGQS